MKNTGKDFHEESNKRIIKIRPEIYKLSSRNQNKIFVSALLWPLILTWSSYNAKDQSQPSFCVMTPGNTISFNTALDFLQLGIWNRLVLLKDRNYHDRMLMVVDHRYGVSICTMRTDLFNVPKFSFSLSSTSDFTFYEQLNLLEKQLTLTLPVHLVQSP